MKVSSKYIRNEVQVNIKYFTEYIFFNENIGLILILEHIRSIDTCSSHLLCAIEFSPDDLSALGRLPENAANLSEFQDAI